MPRFPMPTGSSPLARCKNIGCAKRKDAFPAFHPLSLNAEYMPGCNDDMQGIDKLHEWDAGRAQIGD